MKGYAQDVEASESQIRVLRFFLCRRSSNFFHLGRELLFFLRVFLTAVSPHISQSSYILGEFSLLLSFVLFFFLFVFRKVQIGATLWLDSQRPLLATERLSSPVGKSND